MTAQQTVANIPAKPEFHRKLGEGQGAIFIMRHFPAPGGDVIPKHAAKMSAQIKAYWNQIGLARPEIAICTTESRSQQTAEILGFAKDEIALTWWDGHKKDINLASVLSIGQSGEKYRSALYIGHAPQVYNLWKDINDRKTIPVIDRNVDRNLEGRISTILNGTDTAPLRAKFERVKGWEKREDYREQIATIDDSNAYCYAPSFTANGEGHMFWAGHKELSLKAAFDKKSFVDGETFMPGWDFVVKPAAWFGAEGSVTTFFRNVMSKKDAAPHALENVPRQSLSFGL